MSAALWMRRDKFTWTTKSCGENGAAWPLSQEESTLSLALTGFYWLSNSIHTCDDLSRSSLWKLISASFWVLLADSPQLSVHVGISWLEVRPPSRDSLHAMTGQCGLKIQLSPFISQLWKPLDSPWGWMCPLLRLWFCFPLCPILLPSFPFHQHWFPRALPRKPPAS